MNLNISKLVFCPIILAQRMELSKKQRDAIQSCEQRPHNLPLVEASNAQEKKVLELAPCM